VILIQGTFRLPVEQLAAARESMARVVSASRAEDGCHEYAYAEDLLEPGLIRVSERWESRAHLAAHFKAPHMARWVEERVGLGLSDRQITLYEADSGTAV
jgi:quinol monooxygenase YgiN